MFCFDELHFVFGYLNGDILKKHLLKSWIVIGRGVYIIKRGSLTVRRNLKRHYYAILLWQLVCVFFVVQVRENVVWEIEKCPVRRTNAKSTKHQSRFFRLKACHTIAPKRS